MREKEFKSYIFLFFIKNVIVVKFIFNFILHKVLVLIKIKSFQFVVFLLAFTTASFADKPSIIRNAPSGAKLVPASHFSPAAFLYKAADPVPGSSNHVRLIKSFSYSSHF